MQWFCTTMQCIILASTQVARHYCIWKTIYKTRATCAGDVLAGNQHNLCYSTFSGLHPSFHHLLSNIADLSSVEHTNPMHNNCYGSDSTPLHGPFHLMATISSPHCIKVQYTRVVILSLLLCLLLRVDQGEIANSTTATGLGKEAKSNNFKHSSNMREVLARTYSWPYLWLQMSLSEAVVIPMKSGVPELQI